MGLWSRLKEGAEEALRWVERKIRNAKNKIEEWIGNSGPYNGETIPERVNIEKELNSFKKNIEKEASELEKKRIEAILMGFNVFIEVIEDKYPTLSDIMKTKKKEIVDSLNGTITNYVNVHVSENNYQFKSILEMNPGREKNDKIRKHMDLVLDNARSNLNKKLEKGMDELYSILADRLQQSLAEKEVHLKEELEIYEKLKIQKEQGIVNEQVLVEQYQFCLEM